MAHIDTHSELHIARWKNGIKLVKPDRLEAEKKSLYSPYSIGKAFELPFNIFFIDANCLIKKVNERCAESCGFDSPESIIGNTANDFLTRENADLVLRYDREAIKKATILITEHDLHRSDGEIKNCLSVRAPWYGDDNQIIGILGCSISLGEHNLVDSLNELKDLGLLIPLTNNTHELIDHVYLSKRELECLKLVVRGRTIRQVAEFTGLSKRTVEHYMENIKIKMNVSSKSELIEKVIDYI